MSKNGFRWVVVTSALAAIVLCVSTISLRAQTVAGTILGTVQDQQGATIAKANVSAKSLDTGATRTAVSDDSGNYRIAGVPAGSYEVSSTAPGFKTEVRGGVGVTVGADVALNFSMTVGAVTERWRSPAKWRKWTRRVPPWAGSSMRPPSASCR